MYIASFDIKKELNITIHNQHPDLELTSLVYCSNGTTCHVSPNQKIDAGTAMEASFGIRLERYDFKGALLYKLQRKYINRTDNQPNTSVVFISNTTTNIYFLVAWVVENYKHRFCICLIGCTDDLAWDEDKLWALYWDSNKKFNECYESNTITWLIYEDTVVKTRHDITYGANYELDVTISEGVGKYKMLEPIQIDPERLVLPLSMLIMLMYVVRLRIKPTFKLNIHNQCLNIDLVSPKYSIPGLLKCHRAPDHKAYTGGVMRSSFIVKSEDLLSGALICALHRKPLHESVEVGKDTSSSAYLLVVWRISRSKVIYADIQVIKSDEGFDWNEKNLRKFYSKNIDQFKPCPIPVIETWSLDANTKLMITFDIVNGGQLLCVAISEIERAGYVRMPAYINLGR
jgi:hypothetical protein